MKVLAVIDALNFGGAENLLATLGQVGPRHDLDVQVLSLAADSGARASWLPVLQGAGLTPRFLGIPRLSAPSAVPRLARAIRTSGCDVVHAHLEDSATLAPLATRITGHPCVSTYHHVPSPLTGRDRVRERLSIAAASRAERVLFVSQASYDGFAATYRCPKPNWAVVHNGIDLKRFRPSVDRPEALPKDINVPLGVPIVTVLARLGEGKGQHVAVAAWPLVLAQVPEARLLLVGDGPLEARLRSQVAELGLQHRVIFAGRRTDADVILAASTLACLPSQREALPTALMEAAACGVPAVASGRSGVVEVIDHDTSGLLFEYGDEDGLARAILALLLDRPRREAMGVAARHLAEERFDADVWAERLAEVYRQACAQAARRWMNRFVPSQRGASCTPTTATARTLPRRIGR